MTSIHLIYCPFPTREAAKTAAQALLAHKHAVCCNILPACESHYIWEGKAVMSEEFILIAKTPEPQLEAAREQLSALHPYSCPAILSFSATANPAFAAWAGAFTTSCNSLAPSD